MMGMNMEGLDTPFTWEYDETNGFLKQLSYPNGMVRKNTYHSRLNLLASIGYEDAGTGNMLAGDAYQYDNLMRPTQRRDSWDTATPTITRYFTYNSRSELINDELQQRGNFAYQYDNIGNRKTASELGKEVSYHANRLNQYTNIIQEELDFKPSFDPDGNQTRIRTSTGIWNVCYDANDRPVSFTSGDGRSVVACGYDSQGRRFEKKVVVNGTVVSHAYYLYRGYLQVAELNLMHPQPVLEKSYLWDPTESVATRLLMMTCWKENGMADGEHLFFTHDALKNVTSIFDGQQARRARYEYAPFGGMLTAEGDTFHTNKFRFSCEYTDDELGLVYYNYRHLNPSDGRWINRDPIAEQAGYNLYGFAGNNGINGIDKLGFAVFLVTTFSENDPILKGKTLQINPEDLKNIDDFLTDLDNVSEEMFKKAVSSQRVKFNNRIFKGKKADYRKKVEREKTSKTENISTGGLTPVIQKLKDYSQLAKENYDVIGLVAHGEYIDSGANGWHPTKSVDLAGVTTKMDEIEKSLKEINKPVKWVSCFRDGKHKESAVLYRASGKVNFKYNILMKGGKIIKKEKINCSIYFNPFRFSRFRVKEEGPQGSGATELVE